MLTGIACGIAPALASTRRDFRNVLAESARTLGGGHDRLGRVFVVAELALAIVLLSGAGLLAQELRAHAHRRYRLSRGRRRGDGDELVAEDYPTPQAVTEFGMRVRERLREIPGVDDASAVNFLPLAGGGCAS